MSLLRYPLLFALPALALANDAKTLAESAQIPHAGPACVAVDRFFEEEVWTKVAEHSCLKCHKDGGDARDTKLVLLDPARDRSAGHADSLTQNRAAFERVATIKNDGKSRLLQKATGRLGHEGDEAVKLDSPEYKILAEFVRRIETPTGGPRPALAAPTNEPPFFDGVTMLEDRRLLRRLTLSLAARLPTAVETASVQKNGLTAIGAILDGVLKEDAFYDRLAEAFNDIFLTRGYDGNPETALSYEHFSTTRGWAEKFDLDSIPDPSARQKQRYKVWADYREAMLREPTELIKYIVREDHPFSEIISADYIMVSPYTARGYGVFDELKEKFKNPDDPFDFVPVRLKALISRDKRDDMESATGFYPHAGILSTFQYLRRYPTTETNRNRLRARMYYQHFLGVDVLELAARVTDAAAVQAKFEIPTMQAAECVVCHRTLDPVSSLFQDYYKLEGVYGKHKGGWFKDMFQAGFEGEDMPPEQRWRSLQWLAEKTVEDPRFARTMVEHVYYVMTGRKVLLPPKALDDPEYDAKRRAYQAQHKEVEAIAAKLVAAKFNLKVAFKEWAVSPFYRADAISTNKANPARRAELADVGQARMLAPEQLERKIAAIFLKPWNKLNDKQLSILYGGIDSKEVTERAADPSGAMGAIQRIMANDVACKNVAADFSVPPAQRRLFPNLETDVLPGDADSDRRIRAAIAYLHERVLGRFDAPDSPAVSRTFQLFTDVLTDAHSRKLEDHEIYSCRTDNDQRMLDPNYTVRAWRGVITYLLRQQDFLYE